LLDKLIHIDQELLIYLNNLGSTKWDAMWLYITNQFHWIPLFLLILLILFWKLGWKNASLLLLFIAAMITFSDQFTNLIKYSFERLRPCNDPEIIDKIRTFDYRPRGFGFFSGHAATSSIITTFLILLLKDKLKYIWLLIFFPLTFGYSRIYLGVHFPLDVFSGFLAGFMFGNLFYYLNNKIKISNRF